MGRLRMPALVLNRSARSGAGARRGIRAALRGFVPAAAATLVLAAAGSARPADPEAVVIRSTGAVEVERADSILSAVVGTALEPGDRLRVPEGGSAVLMYRTGRIVNATTSLTIGPAGSGETGSVYRQTLQTLVQVATTDAARQPNRQGMIRPVPGEAVPVAPRNGIRVIDMRPSFTWFGVPDAGSYMVQIRRMDIRGARPVRFDAGTDTVWTYPAAEAPLVPGGTYRWTVAAMPGGRPAQEVEFRVIDAADLATLAGRLDELAVAGVDPAGDGLFLTALWYRDADLAYEAERALARLAANGAGAGRTFHLLHGAVLDRIGDLDRAADAFRAADAEPGS